MFTLLYCRLLLEEVEWMDPVTKQNALSKAAAMVAHIGYCTVLRLSKPTN